MPGETRQWTIFQALSPQMRGSLIKILSIVLSILATAAVVLRYTMDWVGRSTVAEDFTALLDKGGVALTWLAEQPSFIFYWMPAALITTSLLLAFQPELVSLVSSRSSRAQRLAALGERCTDLAHSIGIAVQVGRLKTLDEQNSIWAKYLPIAVELEKYGMKTPDEAFGNAHEISIKRTYLQFVGNLLMYDQLKTAIETASRLSAPPSPTISENGSLPQQGTAPRTRL